MGGKRVKTVFFQSDKTKETFVLGEHLPTRTRVKGGTPVYVERHWHFSFPGSYGHKEVEQAIELNATNAVFGKNDAVFNLDQWVNNPVVGGKFELFYVVKFSD